MSLRRTVRSAKPGREAESRPAVTRPDMSRLIVKGAREHNLRNVDLDLPRDSMIVFTGPLRLRQVIARVRHDLRRGPAPLRRIALRLRPAVPGPGGQARRRLHRGPLARGVHRPEVHQQEPPLHRGHHHRDLRLHAPPVGPCRPPALPRLRRARHEADPAADRRPAAGTAGGHPLPGPGPGGPRPQGRIRRTVQGTHRQGLLAGAGRRQADPAERSPQARQAVQAHHRSGGRPPGGQGRHQPAPHRLGGNRPRASPRGGSSPSSSTSTPTTPNGSGRSPSTSPAPTSTRSRSTRSNPAPSPSTTPSAPAPPAAASARSWRSTRNSSSPTGNCPSRRAPSRRGPSAPPRPSTGTACSAASPRNSASP